jgi:hypothetical protein
MLPTCENQKIISEKTIPAYTLFVVFFGKRGRGILWGIKKPPINDEGGVNDFSTEKSLL